MPMLSTRPVSATHRGAPKCPAAGFLCGICGSRFAPSACEQARVPCDVRAYRQEQFTVWRCPSCGCLERLEPLEIAGYYAGYPVHGAGAAPGWWQRRICANVLRQLCRNGLDKTAQILDYGCGHGQFVHFLRQRGFRGAEGYDPFVAAFRDPETLRRKYDALASLEVLEHAERPLDLLAEWKERLNPGGLLCLTTPNARGIDLSVPGDALHVLHQPYHIHIFAPGILGRRLVEAGFEVLHLVERSHFDTWWPTVNFRFACERLKTVDDSADAAYEPPRILPVLAWPKLWLYAFAGYWLTKGQGLIVVARAR